MRTLHLRAGFKNQVVEMDGQEFEGCVFHECQMVYRGGEPPIFSDCDFFDCDWVLQDAALRTIGFLAALNMMGHTVFLDELVAQIRSTRVLPPAPEKPTQ